MEERVQILQRLVDKLREHYGSQAREEVVQLLNRQPASAEQREFRVPGWQLRPNFETAAGQNAVQ